MEKLKAKHDHKLTDILKVFIFALFLIMPGLFILPSMLYYGVNKYATAPTEEVEIYEYKQINFNQTLNSFGSINGTLSNVDSSTGSCTFLASSDTYWCRCTSSSLTPFNYNVVRVSLTTNTDTKICIRNGSDIISDWVNVSANTRHDYSLKFLCNSSNSIQFAVSSSGLSNVELYVSGAQTFDLTKMFGAGNEPTIEEFNTQFSDPYYEYTTSKIETIEIDTGTTENYTDITSQIQYNWTSLWKQPLFSWTDYTIVKQGIDNFTGVFGITNTSNISNLIAYELIIVAIYIVIDIVLALFKWLTHLIGEK